MEVEKKWGVSEIDGMGDLLKYFGRPLLFSLALSTAVTFIGYQFFKRLPAEDLSKIASYYSPEPKTVIGSDIQMELDSRVRERLNGLLLTPTGVY